jgi:hypothetical protein
MKEHTFLLGMCALSLVVRHRITPIHVPSPVQPSSNDCITCTVTRIVNLALQQRHLRGIIARHAVTRAAARFITLRGPNHDRG